MKSVLLITLVLLVIQIAKGFEGFEPICHPATLGDDAWAKAECCCSGDCDDRQNWIVYQGNDDFANRCEGKCQECECTRISISGRMDDEEDGSGIEVLKWTSEDTFSAIGAPHFEFNI